MLVALDQTVVGTALPTIVAELKGFDLYAWVATSYLLTSVITVPIFGRLGDYYGRKPFVIASIVVFTVASALCGLANSMMFLVLARGLQGIGGGMLVGTAFACIADLFPDNVVRLRWQVLISSAFGIANAVGPSLGGFLTQYYGWRSVFYVNLPVGALSLFFVWRFLPHLRHVAHEGKMRLDWPGAALIAVALGSLQMFVETVPKQGLNAETITLVAASIASSVALWVWEKRCDYAILPIDMFRNKSLAALFTLAILGGFTMFSLLFYAPLLFQGGFGMSPKDAGLMITPLVVFITIGSIANGRIVTRVKNPNAMLYVGFALLVLACLGVVIATRAMPRPRADDVHADRRTRTRLRDAEPDGFRAADGGSPASRYRDGAAAIAAHDRRDDRHGADRHARHAPVRERRSACAGKGPRDPLVRRSLRSANPDQSRRAGHAAVATRSGRAQRRAAAGSGPRGARRRDSHRACAGRDRRGDRAVAVAARAAGSPQRPRRTDDHGRMNRREESMEEQDRIAVVQQFGRTYRAFMSAFETQVGQPMPRWRILLALHEHAGELSQKKLVERLRVDPGALTRQLKALEALGWIARSVDPRDNRISNVVLTEQGRAAAEAGLPRRNAFLHDTMASLPDDAIAALSGALRMLEQRIQDVTASSAATNANPNDDV